MYGGRRACGGVQNGPVFWEVGGGWSWRSQPSIDQASKHFFRMGDVRYFGCTKDYSSVLQPPGGFGWGLAREVETVGGWLLLGF